MVTEAIDVRAPSLLHALCEASAPELDALPFGVVLLHPDHTVAAYNAAEARATGLPPARVLGRHFFHQVAPCTRGPQVAGRYLGHPSLDAVVPWVFTLRLRATPVTLRLLRDPGVRCGAVVVDWAETTR